METGGNCATCTSLQSLANPRSSKTAGPVYSARLPFVSARAAVDTPSTAGCRRFLMSHFYSGDKVSYPRRLKRPREAVERQLRDERQTRGDAASCGGGAGGGQRKVLGTDVEMRNGGVEEGSGNEKTGRRREVRTMSHISKETSLPSVCLPACLAGWMAGWLCDCLPVSGFC